MHMMQELRRRQKAILREFKTREKKAEKILRKIAAHEKAIEGLQQGLSDVFAMGGAPTPAKHPVRRARRAGVAVTKREGPSQKERVHDLLAKAGRPMSIADIVEGLQAEGHVFKSKKPVAALTVMMYTNKKLFKKVKPGQFIAA